MQLQRKAAKGRRTKRDVSNSRLSARAPAVARAAKGAAVRKASSFRLDVECDGRGKGEASRGTFFKEHTGARRNDAVSRGIVLPARAPESNRQTMIRLSARGEFRTRFCYKMKSCAELRAPPARI